MQELIATVAAAVAAAAGLGSIGLAIYFGRRTMADTRAVIVELRDLVETGGQQAAAEKRVLDQLEVLATRFDEASRAQQFSLTELQAARDLEAFRRLAEQLAELRLAVSVGVDARIQGARKRLGVVLAIIPDQNLPNCGLLARAAGFTPESLSNAETEVLNASRETARPLEQITRRAIGVSTTASDSEPAAEGAADA